jgi:hypothetical protein
MFRRVGSSTMLSVAASGNRHFSVSLNAFLTIGLFSVYRSIAFSADPVGSMRAPGPSSGEAYKCTSHILKLNINQLYELISSLIWPI